MSSKLLVKYLDPNTGKYEYASVVDIGDLDNLKTQVKTDLVSAINSITLSGEVPENIKSQIDGINSQITDLGKAGLTDKQLAEIQIKLDANIIDIMNQVNELNAQVEAELKKDIADLSVDYTSKIEDAQNDYNAKVSEINLNLDEAKSDIVKTKSDLLGIKDELSNSDINYVNVTQDINKINGSLSTKVESSDFDLMQSKVTKNTTDIAQTKENITLLATKSSLDLATERITNAESNIKINSDGIESRVTYEELNSEIQNVNKYGDNMLIGTRNWSAGWVSNDLSQSYITNDTYNHCKIQVINRKAGYHSTNVDGLIIGKTYTASVYFKTGSNSTISNPVFFVGNKEYIMDKVVEDTSLINNWKRVSVSFVASEVSSTTSIRFDFISSGDTGYLVSPKLEFGAMATPWKPYFEDDNESIIKNESSIKQNSDSIVSLVSSTEKLGEDVETANTQITQTAESLSLQAQKITDIEGEVSENNASIVLANNKIETKVSQTDVDKSISDISLDTKNRIINSDFSRGFSNWNEINSGFTIKKISGVNYAHINRSGLINVSIASMTSDKFPAKNGDKLVFSLDFMTESISSLDDKTIMAIELFDINDTRVFSKTFNVADFNVSIVDNVITRVSSKYIVNREDVAKARLKLQLNKNGSVNFSKISLQKGDLKEKEWLLAPEDIQLLNVDLQTSITQNANNIELRATKTELNTINNAIKENKASIELTNNAISQKVSSTEVEYILNDKSYATKSDVNKIGKYTTYAYSADGTDRFTTVYPNLNLLKNTKSQSYTSTGTAENISSNNYPLGGVVADILNKPLTITYNYTITNSTGTWSGYIRPTYGLGGADQSVSNTNLSGTHKETITLTGVGFDSYGIVTSGLPAGTTVTITNLKIEFGSTSTPWMPSPSEDPLGAIPKYVGTAALPYDSYSKYEWKINVDWINQFNLNQQSEITNAQNAADKANNSISDMSKDSILTPIEKRKLLVDWTAIQSEYSKLVANANKFVVSTTAYTSAYSVLSGYILSLISNLTINSTIVANTFKTNFKNYYDAKVDLMNNTNLAIQANMDALGTNTAYSYSIDGTDRFTTVYPNLNLLKGTKTPKSITGNNTVNQGGLLYSFDNNSTLNNQGFSVNDTVTLEFDWSATNPASGTFILQWQGTPWGFNVPTIKISSTNGSGHVTHTFNITDLQIASTSVATGIGYRFDNIPANTVITFSNVIISKSKTSQLYMPSEKELTSDDIPKYVGYSVRQSENPEDFSWQPYGGLNSYNITKATTAIDQNSKEIALKANKLEVNTLSGKVLATESSLQIQDGKISALNTKTDGHTTQIGTLESSYNGLTSTISEIQTDVGGKAGKTELSQLSQDLSGFKTTVANTYADKVSVASQITQSATAVTSNVQSWTNNKLTAYSTTQQTATSITNAVASKADKSQVTQLSDQITSVVTDVSAIQVGGENLLIDTDIGDLAKVNAPGNRYFSDAGNAIVTAIGFKQVSDSPTPSGYVVEATSIGGGSSGGRRIAFYSGSESVPFVKGETYTMSCYARKISGNPKIPFQYGNGTDGYNNKGVVDVDSTNWKQYSLTFVYDFNNPSTAYLGGIGSLTAGTLQSCGFKVERGNKATSWGLSQYELASKADKSQITQLSDNITSTVTGLTNESLITTQMMKDTTLVHPSFNTMPMVEVPVTNGETYTVSSNQPWEGNAAHMFFIRATSTSPVTGINGVYDGKSITLPALSDKIYIVFRNQNFLNRFIDGKYWVRVVSTSATRSQITQLSDNINLKVSKGDVVSQINLEAGKTLINSNKIVLNANTTEINGNAFINGSMIVDGSLKAKQISVDNLASINNTLGNVKSANLTNTTTYLDSKNVSHTTVFNVSDGITFKDSYKIGSINNVDNINMNTKDNISLDLAHYEGGLMLNSGLLSPTSLIMKDWQTGSRIEYSSTEINMVTPTNSSRIIAFSNEGIKLKPGKFNDGQFDNNTGIELLGLRSYIDFHNTLNGAGKDFVSRLEQGPGAFQIVSENAINLQGLSVNVRNMNDSGWSPIYASSFQQQSSKDIKYNIKDLKDGYLNDLKKINFKSYRQVSPRSVYQIGLILEENIEQPFATKEGVDLYSYVTFIAKALQEEIIKREKLEEEIKEIQNGKKY